MCENVKPKGNRKPKRERTSRNSSRKILKVNGKTRNRNNK